MKKRNASKYIMLCILLIVAYFANRFAAFYHAAEGQALLKILNVCNSFWPSVLNNIFYFSLDPIDLTISGCAVILLAMLYFNRPGAGKNFRTDEEYGSARWGTPKDAKKYVDPVFSNNIILTQTERLTMSGRVKPAKNGRNKNVVVIGGSGSGKTRFFVKPNLMQLHSSYVVVDPKGSLLEECGSMFQKARYKIKVLNTVDFAKSMHYNPFMYIHSEKDILKLVNTIIANTKGEGEQSKEDFWVKAEKLYYTALIAYIYSEAPEREKNFGMLIDLLDASEVREDDEDFTNPVDELFDELTSRSPSHFAVRQYKKYKLAAGKTAKSILISCGARLAPFDVEEMRQLTDYDEMNLDLIGDRKTALFIIVSDTDDTFNFIVSILYTQLFNILCERADKVYHGRLPIHVRCILDEFANIGQIPKFEKLIATIRSREISACIILQTQAQLKSIYKDNSETIIGNCDSKIFLGGEEEGTLKSFSTILGKETIDLCNQGITKGSQKSNSQNYQKLGRELMTIDELSTMDGGMCICKIRGEHPFFSKKFDIEKHPNYKYLSDANEANRFEIKEAFKQKPIVSQDEEFIMIDLIN